MMIFFHYTSFIYSHSNIFQFGNDSNQSSLLFINILMIYEDKPFKLEYFYFIARAELWNKHKQLN